MKVAIVQRRLRKEKSLLYELRELAEAAGYQVVLEVEQIRKPDTRYQIGYGKALELAKKVEEEGIEKVIFFNELKPVQIHNLSKLLGVEVVDRITLILEIFAKRAGSKESKLQIELAKLKRELSYVKEQLHLAKLGELPGYLGGGEYIIDSYRQHVIKRISKIERELEKIRKRKNRYWSRRLKAGIPTVVLTGYTRAGKTTLFKALTGEQGYVDGRPFATLSTTSRRIVINGKEFIISDTIGFIDALPPILVEAFYTTLAEIAYSDLILLVVDLSDPIGEIERKLQASLDALHTVGVFENNVLGVLNKIDIAKSGMNKKLEIVRSKLEDYVLVSALKGEGIELLKEKICQKIGRYIQAEIEAPVSTLNNLWKIMKEFNILELTVENEKAIIKIELKRIDFMRLASHLRDLNEKIRIRTLSNGVKVRAQERQR